MKATHPLPENALHLPDETGFDLLSRIASTLFVALVCFSLIAGALVWMGNYLASF